MKNAEMGYNPYEHTPKPDEVLMDEGRDYLGEMRSEREEAGKNKKLLAKLEEDEKERVRLQKAKSKRLAKN